MLVRIKWAITLLLVAANLAFPQSGTLDSSFGVNGVSKIDFRRTLNVDDYGGIMQLDRDGKIVVFGCTADSSNTYYCLFRLDKDGTPDSTFQKNGKLLIPSESSLADAKATSFIIDSAGNLLLAGKLDSTGYSLLRLNSNGQTDSAFGIHGIVPVNEYVGIPGSPFISLDYHGKIILAGNSSSNDSIVLVRLTDQGLMDNTFGCNGKLMLKKNNPNFKAFKIDSKNRILVAEDNGISNYSIQRFMLDGNPDTAFAGNGLFQDSIPFSYNPDNCAKGGYFKNLYIDKRDNIIYNYIYTGCDLPSAYANMMNEDGSFNFKLERFPGDISNITFDKNGRILVTGYGYIWYGYYYYSIYCFKSDGTRDSTFGESGKLRYDQDRPNIKPERIFYYGSQMLDKDNRILLAGTKYNLNNFDFIIRRLTGDGDNDSTFGEKGQTFINGNKHMPFFDNGKATKLMRDPKGRLLVAGYTFNDLGIIRLDEIGELDTSFNQTGKYILPVDFIELPLFAIDQEDNILINGWSYKFGDVLIRILGNGQIDTHFGNNGMALLTNIGSISVTGIEIDSLGKILLTGENYFPTHDCFIFRLTSEGIPDSTFNKNGLFFFKGSSKFYFFPDNSDGKMLIVNDTSYSNARFLKFMWLNDAGSLYISMQFIDTIHIDEVKMDINQRLIIKAGIKEKESETYHRYIICYNYDGSIDSTFGNGGRILLDKNIESRELYVATNNPDKLFLSGNTGKGLIVSCFNNSGIDTTFAENGQTDTLPGLCNDLIADSNFIWIAGANSTLDGFKISKFYARNNQSIDFTLPDTLELGIPPYRLDAMATSGLNVSYFSSDQTIANIVNDTLNIFGTGALSIIAGQPGNSSFYAANPVSKDLFVKSAHISPTNILSGEEFKFYPNPVSTTLFLESNSGMESIIITDVEGKELYKKTGIDENNCQINMSVYKPGCYFITVQYNRTRPPVIQKVFKL
jgi:uncharacterized delta-60 repeat protein